MTIRTFCSSFTRTIKPTYLILAVGYLLGNTYTGLCQSFIPASDETVVEHLPSSVALFKAARKQEVTATSIDKQDLSTTITNAQKLIEEGRANADPRAISYAQSLLSPWLKEANPPIATVILSATIKDHMHDFRGALEDFGKVLAANPANLQALVSTASIHTVLGELDEARDTCTKLLRPNTTLLAAVCASAPASLQGDAQPVFDALSGIFADPFVQRAADATEISWAQGLLGEIAERMGNSAEAETRFVAALTASPNDSYLLGAYSDLLIDEKQYVKAIKLLSGHEAADPLLLRLAIAKQKSGDPTVSENVTDLESRFAAERARQDSIHRREEARFLLEIKHDPSAALPLAKANWAQQKEPIDLILLATSATQINDAEGLKTVSDWRQRWVWRDVRLDAALVGEKLNGQPQMEVSK